MPSISVIITAMNEEGNLESAVDKILRTISSKFSDYELLIINDGSRDRTAEIADRLAAQHSEIRVVHNPINMGLDYSYKKGIELANKKYIAWVAGNDLVPVKAFEDIFEAVGKADTISTYLLNDPRPLPRQITSRLVVHIFNFLFGLRLRYYTGPCVYKSENVKAVKVITKGSAAVAEILIRQVKSNSSHLEIGLHPKMRSSGKTKTFRLKNFINIGKATAQLFWDIRIAGAFSKKSEMEQNLDTDRVLSRS